MSETVIHERATETVTIDPSTGHESSPPARGSPTRSSGCGSSSSSECLLFGGLISTYLLLHDRSR